MPHKREERGERVKEKREERGDRREGEGINFLKKANSSLEETSSQLKNIYIFLKNSQIKKIK